MIAVINYQSQEYRHLLPILQLLIGIHLVFLQAFPEKVLFYFLIVIFLTFLSIFST